MEELQVGDIDLGFYVLGEEVEREIKEDDLKYGKKSDHGSNHFSDEIVKKFTNMKFESDNVNIVYPFSGLARSFYAYSIFSKSINMGIWKDIDVSKDEIKNYYDLIKIIVDIYRNTEITIKELVEFYEPKEIAHHKESFLRSRCYTSSPPCPTCNCRCRSNVVLEPSDDKVKLIDYLDCYTMEPIYFGS